jgi:hypothetical protein
MSLITAHKILIASAVALFIFYALWELMHYFSSADGWAIARCTASAIVAIGFGLYYPTIDRRYRPPSD